MKTWWSIIDPTKGLDWTVDDMADGGVFTCEYDYEETVMWPVFDGETIVVRANSEERSDRGTCGDSDRPAGLTSARFWNSAGRKSNAGNHCTIRSLLVLCQYN